MTAASIPARKNDHENLMTSTRTVASIFAGLVFYAVISVSGIAVSRAEASPAPMGCAPLYSDWLCTTLVEAQDKANEIGHFDKQAYCTPALPPQYKLFVFLYPNVDVEPGEVFVWAYACGGPPVYGSNWGEASINFYFKAPAGTYVPNKNAGPEICPKGKKPLLQCGNPINVAIGNKYQVESDFALTPLLAFTRYYNSIDIGRTRGLGAQWSYTYARSVDFFSSGNGNPAVIVSRPEGNRLTFRLSSGVWTSDADVIATLVRRDDAHGGLLGWTFTPQDGREVEQYDALGRLLQITKSDGGAINLTYNNGVIENNANDLRLTQVQAQDGRSLVFTYDTSNRIHQITDPAGGVYLYGYDTSGRLSTVTYPGGAQHTYLYSEPAFTGGASLPNALTGIVHEDGQRFATFNYQADGRAISTEHAGALDKFAVQYNVDGTSTVTTPLGTTQQRTFNTVLGVKKATGIVESCADCNP
jgi:YD repeat-containing protein